MKVGICTQPLTTNYGGILQNYALQTILKRLGHKVWTIDYFRFNWLDWFVHILKTLIHKLLGHDRSFGNTPIAQANLEKPLRRFVDRYISLTKPRTKFYERSVVCKYGFEAVIVGSDQVWRPNYNPHIEKSFLSFTKNLNIKRVAYAASFGTDKWEFDVKQSSLCIPLAQQFDAISVRENSGIMLCEDYLHVKAEHVLDPTLLLKSDDYFQLCADIEKKKPFIFAYILDASNQKVDEIRKFAESKGLEYFIMSAGPQVKENDSVEQWLSYFRDAKYIITDSFHGTAFSINFGKEFYVFGNKQRGNSRFSSLLGLLGLQNRILQDSIVEQNEIDWNSVFQKLDDERSRCIEWLTKSLK